MTEDFVITVQLDWPYGRKSKRRSLVLSRLSFERAFNPLPRDHDLPFAFDSHALARDVIQARRQAVDLLKSQLAGMIEELMREDDTRNGYTREELKS